MLLNCNASGWIDASREHTRVIHVKLRVRDFGGIGMPLGGQRILVVEDESAVAFDVGCIIRKARGAVAAYAANLRQAMKLADELDFSLAVLDFRLGPHNSLPLAAKLQAAGIPFIFHTGCGISEVEKVYPCATILAKPAAAEDLIASLVDLLSVRAAKLAAGQLRTAR